MSCRRSCRCRAIPWLSVVVPLAACSRHCLVCSLWQSPQLTPPLPAPQPSPPGFLDRIKQAYQRNPELPNLLVDPDFAQELGQR